MSKRAFFSLQPVAVTLHALCAPAFWLVWLLRLAGLRRNSRQTWLTWPACLTWLVLLCGLCVPTQSQADAGANTPSLDFSTIRLGQDERTVLVVGGIQGDEPGGFSAATLLATRYEILSGAVWVVPNLNFPSIIKRSRGLHGDMNRKFARLDKADPEFSTVRRIQDIINLPEVALVLNLHDGSGYFRHTYEDKLNNPARWGQSIIIDQDNMPVNIFLHNLADAANSVASEVNNALLAEHHKLHVHNTKTSDGDEEMVRSLSYYAVQQGKAAFGLEASKEFSVELRAYYHLRMLEAFLRLAGVEFTRDFALTPAGIREALRADVGVSFAGNRIFLPLDDVRPTINHLPLPKGGGMTAVTSKPIMAVLPCTGKRQNDLCIHYGNSTVALIRPDWRDVDHSLTAVRVTVDGRDELVPFGRVLRVSESLMVHPHEGFRVNAIGVDSGRTDESGLTLKAKNFLPRFSLDKQATLYRIEVYKNRSIAGMFLVRFGPERAKTASGGPLPATTGPESTLGF